MTALPVDVERKLAELVGIEPVVSETFDEADHTVDPSYDEVKATHFAKRVLQVAQRVTVGSLVLLVGCALAAARINSTSLQVHPIPLTAWAVAAAMSAVGLAALVTDPDVAVKLSPIRRRALGCTAHDGAAGLDHRRGHQRGRRRGSDLGAVPAGRRGVGCRTRPGCRACWSVRWPAWASTWPRCCRTP